MNERSGLPSLPKVGDRVDRYQLIAELAHGGMAVLYVARRTGPGGFDKLVAVKMLLPHLATDRRFVDMFLDEARIASTIQHPHVVHVFDVGERNRLPFMVMELLRGHSLARVAKAAQARGERVPLRTLLAILAAAAEGLHGAHETRAVGGERLCIVHRDVSPQNIHVGYDGQVKVVDFGIAAARGRLSETRSGEIKGKFQYLAPEQLGGGHAPDRRLDVWSLGVTAWELIAGRRLFKDADEARTLWNVMSMDIPRLRDVAPDVPEAVSALVMQCLERDPDGRPATALELAVGIREALGSEPWDFGATCAALMERYFQEERRSEDERLKKAVRSMPADDAPSAEEAPAETGRAPGGSTEESALRAMGTPAATLPATGNRGRAPRLAHAGTDGLGAHGAAPVVASGGARRGRRRGRRWSMGIGLVVTILAATGLLWTARQADDGAGENADGPLAGSEPKAEHGARLRSSEGSSKSRSERGTARSAAEGGSAGEIAASGDAGEAAGVASPQTIAVHVGPRVRRVLVNGQARSERPLQLQVTPDNQVEVTLFGRGQRARRIVGIDDDGRRLALPRRRGHGSRRGSTEAVSRRRARPDSQSATREAPGKDETPASDDEPLLGNPY